MEMIKTENERKLEKEVEALKKQLEEKDHMIKSLGDNYVSQKEIHDELWGPVWEHNGVQGKEIKRLQKELEKEHRKTFKVERELFCEQGKRWMVEWEVHCLKKDIKKLKRGQKNA